jgi:hypothetical protein
MPTDTPHSHMLYIHVSLPLQPNDLLTWPRRRKNTPSQPTKDLPDQQRLDILRKKRDEDERIHEKQCHDHD